MISEASPEIPSEELQLEIEEDIILDMEEEMDSDLILSAGIYTINPEIGEFGAYRLTLNELE